MKPQSRKDRRRSGIALPMVALAVIPLIGVFGLAATMGEMALMDHKLQNYVDARAVGAVKDRFGGYTQFVEINEFLGSQTANAADAECGRWDHGTRRYGSGCPDGPGVPAFLVEHTISHDLAFGAFSRAVGGPDQVTLAASATAFIPRRSIMLVQDVSTSLSSIDPSKAALLAMLDSIADQDLPGDQMGLATFGSEADTPIGLTPLATGEGAVRSAIQNLALAGATCTEGGMRAGAAAMMPIEPEHETYPLMIIVTDGSPNVVCSQDSGDAVDEAEAARDEACAAGIHVWSIFVDGNGGDPDQARDLACAPENFREASNESEVAGLITEILTNAIPVRLVQ